MNDNENLSYIDRLKNWLRNSISVKIAAIIILVLLLLIPSAMIRELINERQYRQEDTYREVTSKWGQSQTLKGPVLSVPYKTYTVNSDGKVFEHLHHAHFLPEILKVDAEVIPQTLKRGIYKVVLYNAVSDISGHFKLPDFTDWKIDEEDILWEDAFITFGTTDLRGIKELVKINWRNNEIELNPGIECQDVITTGVSGKVPLNPEDSTSTEYPFSMNINLNGSYYFNFVPIGDYTEVHMHSSWTDPSFDGAFLPDNREINDSGFIADWKVLQVNTAFPQQWLDDKYNIESASFGTKLIIPVDSYQKTTRTNKYAIMFIALTFVVFLFVEILNKMRIHAFQYALVGLAIILFYLMLLSISEHLAFNAAYLISSAAITVMITVYSLTIFRSIKLSALMAVLLVTWYGFMFFLLQSQDFALLFGSIGLFIVLATVMYFSRKINWEEQ